MDEIIVLKNGKVVDSGSYNEIRSRGVELAESEELTVEPDQECLQYSADGQGGINKPSASQIAAPTENCETVDSAGVDLRRRQGSWSVYAYYCRSAGALCVISWAAFTLIGAVASNFMSKFLHGVKSLVHSTNFLTSDMDRKVDGCE